MKKAVTVMVSVYILLASFISVYSIEFNAESVYNSVFVISTSTSIGSGFAIGKNIIITNHHVVDDARYVEVSTYDGQRYDGEIYASDKKLDIAIVLVNDVDFVPLKTADDKAVKIGDDIYTIGAPNSLAYTLTKGVISAKDRVISGQKYLQIDAAINMGNSGGPLLNEVGEVLGINTMKVSDAEGIGLSIPISVVINYMSECGIDFDSDNTASLKNEEIVSKETVQEAGNTFEDKTENEIFDIKEPEKEDNKNSFYINISIGSAMFVFIVLTIILVYRKNKGKYIRKPDPSERTDFEIEIED